MATKILIPTPLRPYTDKKDAVDADGATVGELLADLTAKHPGLKAHLYNEQGKLRSFVHVDVDEAAQLALFVVQVRFQPWMLRGQVRQQLADRGAIGVDGVLLIGVRPQRSRNQDFRRHEGRPFRIWYGRLSTTTPSC